MALRDGRYRGPLFRALNPVHARDPLSGRGAERHGGRFNARGRPALYTSLDPATALREANQVGDLQPTVLVSYRANLGPVFDARDDTALASHGLTAEALADPGWRVAMLDGRRVPTQDLAAALVRDGFAGMLVRSFAKRATPTMLNLVLWRWSDAEFALAVVDDEDRLGRL